MKRHDLWPPVEATLEDASGPVDLTGATVKFIMSDMNRNLIVDASAVIVDAGTGKVKYEWQSGDTDTVGNFHGEFEVTWDGGKPQTFPNEGFIKIKINPDLG